MSRPSFVTVCVMTACALIVGGSPAVFAQVQGSQRPGEQVLQPAMPKADANALTKIHDVRPVYPPEAAAAGVSGPVILTLTIDAAGLVTDAKVITGDVTLAPAALDAVRQWRYRPPATAPVVATVGVNVEDVPQPAATIEAVRITGSVKPPTKIKDVRPVYPEPAQNARVQGVTIIEATIGPSGSVTDARILRSIPQLDVAALDAVLRWKFTPTVLNGVPVPVIMTATVNFALDSASKSGVSGGVGPGGVIGGIVGGPVVGGIVESKDTGTGSGGGRGGAGVKAGVASGTPSGSEPVRVGSGIRMPARTKYVAPIYPPEAKAAKVQGMVVVEVVVGKDGKVEDAKILRSIPELDAAALEAVRQWEFTPTLLNGEPVPVVMTATVNFKLQ